ncbi:glycosyltransferase family 2 protein [Dysosmobacter sp. Sow4_B12]|uniref:glycosyltransferase family 2 protein n=1 Tax=Dysosmobacter sp. Sow4_B12 TaxID=3438777 RepID=UPI003F91F867
MISVIVPVYNTEAFLCDCIDSILAQTYTDFELILVDDGSQDACGAICDDYMRRDNRVRVIHQENKGQSVARNNAVTQAKGEWVCYVDSDDLVHPQMLELLYRAMIEGHADIAMCSAVESLYVPDWFKESKEGKILSAELNEEKLEQLYELGGHRAWVVWGKIIRKEIVQKIPFTEGRIYEDNAVVCRWLVEAKRVSDVDAPLYFYRFNPLGTTKKDFQIKQLDCLWAIEEIVNFFKSIGYQSLRKRFCSRYMTTAAGFYWKAKNELQSPDIAETIKEQMQEMKSQNNSYINLSKAQLLSVYDILYPRRMQAYWLFKAGLKELKEAGVLGFIHGTLNFLHREGKKKVRK